MSFLTGLWSVSWFCHAAPGRTIRLPIMYRKLSPGDHRRTLFTAAVGSHSVSTIPSSSVEPAAPLFQAPGVHYVALEVGCPEDRARGRTITLIVDTGSGAIAFPCAQCHGCDAFHMDRRYNETAAPCYRPAPCRRSRDCVLGKCGVGNHRRHHGAQPSCRIHRRYGEGSSWVATEGSDVVQLGAGAALNLTFGCQTAVSGRFRRQAVDGILGLDRHRGSLWRQAHEQRLIDRRSFSLCFKRLRRDLDSAPAGAMLLGGSDDDALDETPMVFADMLAVDDFYAVHVENIYLRMHGGGSVRANRQSHYSIRYETVSVRSSTLNRAPFIVDSGTTLTYLNENLEYPFSDAWRALTGRHYSPYREYHYSHDELNDILPTVLFQLSPWRRQDNDLSVPGVVKSMDRSNRGSILVAMPPTHYMRFIEEDNIWVSRIFFNSDSKQTLGSNFLQGKNVLFDIDNRRIGFAESSCSANITDWATTLGRNDMKGYAPILDRLHESADRLRNEVVCHPSCRVRLSLFVVSIVIAVAAYPLLRSRRPGIEQDANGEETGKSDGETRGLVSSMRENARNYSSL